MGVGEEGGNGLFSKATLVSFALSCSLMLELTTDEARTDKG